MNNLLKLKKRIKKNEGYRNIVYYDKLGHPTIGYGHLVRPHDKILKNKKYSKNFLKNIFENDFVATLKSYNTNYCKKKFSLNKKEVLIEMIFQLGINGTLKFKKFNKFLEANKTHLAALEMKKSFWYCQTPKRVEGLIKILLGY